MGNLKRFYLHLQRHIMHIQLRDLWTSLSRVSVYGNSWFRISLLFHNRCPCLLWQVYAQKETCSEELNVERAVSKNLRDAIQPSSNSKNATRLELIWGCTMYHIDDLPFNCKDLPDVYTQFRKVFFFLLVCFIQYFHCEERLVISRWMMITVCWIQISNSKLHKNSYNTWSLSQCCRVGICSWSYPAWSPTRRGRFLFNLLIRRIKDFFCLHTKDFFCLQVSKGMKFIGGETAALSRVHEYFWKKAREFCLAFILNENFFLLGLSNLAGFVHL